MKSFLTALFLIAIFCFGSTAQITKQEKFNLDGGMFSISGKAPKAFSSFEDMAFSTHDYKANGKVVPIKPSGTLGAGGRQYKMTKIAYDGKQLSFETLPGAGGISYKFSGKILDNIRYDASGRTIGDVLEGHLIKFVRGKKTAEADLKFQFEEGD